jgi:hypothetical protein
MTSLADNQDQDNGREKVISLQNFLQGPCSYGQLRLCLALYMYTILTLRYYRSGATERNDIRIRIHYLFMPIHAYTFIHLHVYAYLGKFEDIFTTD